MTTTRTCEPIRILSSRLTVAYCVACAFVFAAALGAFGAVWQMRSSAEAEAACSNILSLVIDEVSTAPSTNFEEVRELFDRPAFSDASVRIVGENGQALVEMGSGHGGVDLSAQAKTSDGAYVDVDVSYVSAGPFDVETLPVLILIVVFVAVLVAISSRWFVSAAVTPVEKSLQRQREFVAAASHELRSPLSVVKLNLEAARVKAEEEGAPATRVLVEEADGECSGLSLLVNDLLALASGDAQGWNADLRPCDAETLFVEAFDGMDEKAAQAGIVLIPDLATDPIPPMLADEYRAVQLLRILLENALAFSPKGGKVRMSLRTEGSFVVFAVADQGPGVPDGGKERVFERFYQIDPARSIATHHGLGLSIAQELAQAHHGWIQVRDNEGGGALFEVGFPTIA